MMIQTGKNIGAGSKGFINTAQALKGKRFFIFRVLVVALFFIYVPTKYAMGQQLSNQGSITNSPTFEFCDGKWNFAAEYLIRNGSYSAADLAIEIDWGEGAGGPGSAFTSYPLDGAGFTVVPGALANSTRISGVIEHQYPVNPSDKEECMYQILVRLKINNGPTLADPNIAAYKATVWSRDKDGMGEPSLVERETLENVYPICKGNTDDEIYFWNNSKLACNYPNPATLTGDWVYEKNQNMREYQFVYYPNTGSIGGGIQDIIIPGVNNDQPITGMVEGDVLTWPADGGQLAPDAGFMDVLSDMMTLPVNNAAVGAEFIIECRTWNVCNPRSTHLNDPDVVRGVIRIVEKPADITPRTTSYCFGSTASMFNLDLNYNPGNNFAPGIYRWYRYDDPAGPSPESLANPILVIPNQPAPPANPATTNDRDIHINPTNGFPSNFAALPTHSSFPTNNGTSHRDHRTNRTTPGHYRYWVTYEFSGKVPGTNNSYICPTDPTLLTWTVREDISAPININDIDGINKVCSGGSVELTLPTDKYPDSYPFGGLMEYIWTNPTVTVNGTAVNGIITNIVKSPGSATTAAGRSISFNVDPNLQLVAGNSGIITLTVQRRWATPSSPANGAGSNCPNPPAPITFTVNPLPTATLKPGTVDVCDPDMPTLDITNVAGGTGSTSFTYTLNDGTTDSKTFANKSTTQTVSPKSVTRPAVTEYFVYTIKDETTGCVSTNTYNGTGKQIMPNAPNGVQVTWRANMNSPAGTYDPPADIVTPVANSLLCSDQPRTFDVGTAPTAVLHPGKDVSVDGVPDTDPDDKSFNTQYRWSWTSQSSAAQWTTGTTQTYSPSNNGTVTRAQGEIYVLQLYREYTDQKCGQTTTRRWIYTIIPNPTATISPQTIELCENDDPTRILTIKFTTTGYIVGDWTVGYQLLSHDGTTVLPTVQTTANATQTITPGNGNGAGTISIPLSELNGTPKYGNYTVKLTSVVQNTTANPTCPGTISGTQTITLRRKPEATLSGGPGIICEGKDYTLMPNNSVTLTGESGVDYAITYETRDNGGGLLGNNIVVNPLIDGRFNVSQAYIDQTDALDITTIQLLTVSQSYGSYTCSNDANGTHTIQIDKNPLKAEIPVDRIDVCAEEAAITANDPASYPHRWLIDATTLPADAIGTTDYGFDGTYQPESQLHETTFGIRNQKYGQYKLYWEITAPGGLGVCKASRDSVIVNLATHAEASVITTLPVITCNYTIILQTDKTINSWETPKWSVVSFPAGAYPTPNPDPFQLPGSGYDKNDRMITVPQSGTYIFQYEKQVPSGCDGTLDQVSITFGDNPVVEWDGLKGGSATPYPYYCPGEPIDVTFKETSNKGIPPGQITYTWTTFNAIGNYLAGATQQGALLHVDAAPANATNAYKGYIVNNIQAINTITVTNAGYPALPPPPTSSAPSPDYPDYATKKLTCLSPAKTFTIQVKPTPSFTVKDINVCPDDAILYELNPALATATDANTVWDWKNVTVAPVITNAGLATPISPLTGKTATFMPVQSTTKDADNEFLVAEPNDITLQVTVEGCPSSVEPFSITVNPTPVPSITGRETQPLCPLTDDKLFFTNVVDSTVLQYTWNYQGTTTSTSLTSSSTQEERYHLRYSTSDNLTSNELLSSITATAYGLVPSDVRTDQSVCSATSEPYEITVSPRPNMTDLSPQQMCGTGGTATFNDVLFDVSNRDTRRVDYTWTNVRNTGIAGVDHNETVLSQTTASYSGTAPVAGIRGILIPENNGDTTMVARIWVTPTMTRGNGTLPGCAGPAKEVVLTVLPRPVLSSIPNDTVCAGLSFKTVYPNVVNNTITGVGRIDFSMAHSTPPSVSINQTTYYVNGANVDFKAGDNITGEYLTTTVTAHATGNKLPTGSTVGCVGPDSTFLLVVRPTPVITAPANDISMPIEELCPGKLFVAVPFQANINASHQPPRNAEVIFAWEVQDNDIGSGGNGTVTGNGNPMAGFKAIPNTGGSKITSTIQVTAELEGCKSIPVKFLQRLKPTPQMNPLSDITKCPGDVVPVVGITHNAGGAGNTQGILWEVDTDIAERAPTTGNKVISAGIGNRIAGNTPSFIANDNSTGAQLVSEFLVTAIVEQCESDTVKYKVFVNPSPGFFRPQWMTDAIGTDDTLFVCHENTLENNILYESDLTGTMEWWRTPENIGQTAPGTSLPTGSLTQWRTGAIPRFQALNPTATATLSSEITSTFIVRTRTTSTVGCPSLPDTFAITVGAVPKIGVSNPIICASDDIPITDFTMSVAGSVKYEQTDTVYHWKVTGVDSGWSIDLGLPTLNDDREGSIGTLHPDTTRTWNPLDERWEYTSLWGETQHKINIEAYVTLKTSELPGVGGCPSPSQRMLVTINPLPKTILDRDIDACVADGDRAIYQIAPGTGAPNSDYVWAVESDPSPPADPNNASWAPTIPNPANDSYEVFEYPTPPDGSGGWQGYITIEETNVFSCSAPVEKLRIENLPVPRVYAGPDRIVCAGDTIHLNGKIENFNEELTYRTQWFSTNYIEGTADILNPVVRPPRSETKQLQVGIVMDDGSTSCFSNRDLITINVIEKPQTPVIAPAQYCESDALLKMTIAYNAYDPNAADAADYTLQWFRRDMETLTAIDTIRIANSDSISISMKLQNYHPQALPSFPIDWSVTASIDTLIYYQAYQTHRVLQNGISFACRSDLSQPATLAIRRSPDAPTGGDFAYCAVSGGRYNIWAQSSAGAPILNWYSSEIGNDVVGSGDNIHVTLTPSVPGGHPVTSPILTDETATAPATFTPFTYYVESRNAYCPSPRTKVNLTVYPNPALPYTLTESDGITDASEGCSPYAINAMVNTTASKFVNYQWDWADGTPISGTPGINVPHEFRVTGTVPEQVTVRLIGTSQVYRNSTELNPEAGFCYSEVEQTLTVHPGVKAAFDVTAAEGCDPLPVFFTASGRSEGAYQFRWYWNRPLGANEPSPPYEGNVGNPDVSGNPTHLPNDGPVIPPSTDANDSWYGTTGPNPPQTFTNGTDQPKQYRVWLQVNNLQCYDNHDTIITVFPTPHASFTHNLDPAKGNSICPPDSVNFINTSEGTDYPANTASTMYAWNFGDGKLDTVPFNNTYWRKYESLNASAPLFYMITMSAINKFTSTLTQREYACTATDNRNINVYPQVKAAFTGDEMGCSPKEAHFQSQSLGAVSDYRWEWGDGSTAMIGNSNPSHTFVNTTDYNTPHTYNVKLTVSNSFGCTDAVSHPFLLNPQPFAAFSPDQVLGCQPMTVVFTNTSNTAGPLGRNPSTGMSYLYDWGDGQPATTRNDDNPIEHVFTNSLGRNLQITPTLTATNEWGCVSLPARQNITIYPYVNAFFEMEDSVGCSPMNVRFRNGSQGYESYTYNFGDGNIVTGSQSSGLLTTHPFVNNTADYSNQDFIVTLTVTSGEKCTSTWTGKVTSLAMPRADFRPASPYPSDYLYPAPPIEIDNLIQTPGRDNLDYLWSYTKQASGYASNFSTAILPTPLRITEWGVFDITQRVTAKNGVCINSKTLTVNIVPPAVRANFEDVPPACMPYNVTFVNTSRNANAYLWDFGDGTSSNQQHPTHLYADPGTYRVVLTATGDNPFPASVEKFVTVHPRPQAIFNIQPTFAWVGQELRAFNYTAHSLATGEQYDVWYRWNWGDGSAIDEGFQPSHMYLKAGSYTISLTTGTNTEPQCIDSIAKTDIAELENSGDIILPNIFKPHPDGEPSDVIPEHGYKNYLFYPPVITPTRKYLFVVYSRWGQKLFETTDPKRGWNGYFRGRLCDEGAYFYRIEGVFETGQSFNKIGDITLLR